MNKKFIDIIAINRVLQGIKTELDKGYSTKHNLLDVLEATKKINGANIKLVNAEGVTFNKLFDGTTDIAISASEIGTNTKLEDTTLLAEKVDKVEGKQLSTEDYSTVEKTKLVGIEANANNYTHPSTHSATEIVTDSNRGFVTDIEKVSWTDKYTKSETDAKIAVMTDAIEWKAAVATFEDIATTYPEPQDGWVVNVNDTDITYRYTGTAWIEISANAIPVATTTVDGKMSKSDKAKLDAIEAGANLYVHPDKHLATMIVQNANHRFVTDTEKAAYADKKTKNELDTVLPTKVDISTSASIDEIDSIFNTLFPKPTRTLKIEINGSHNWMIPISSAFKSFSKMRFNGEEVSKIPSGTPGIIELDDAVARQWYSSHFYDIFGYSMLKFEGYLDTSETTDMSTMFNKCLNLTHVDLSSFDTSNVQTMSGMFSECGLVNLDLSNFNTSKVQSMESMFANCHSLETLDLSSFDTSIVRSMDRMFLNCKKLSILKMSKFNMSNVAYASKMFEECNMLTSINTEGWDTSKVTDMTNMFYGCKLLKILDVSSFNTSSVTSMRYMFDNCQLVEELDVSNFNTANVTDMFGMFNRCYSVSNLNLSSFDISKMSSTASMFSGCSSLVTVNLSSFNTSKIKDMRSMFSGCSSLKNIIMSSNFRNNWARRMYAMFRDCTSLTHLDLSTFTSDGVEEIGAMFSGCSSLVELKIPNFNTWRAVDNGDAFVGCTSLTTVWLSGASITFDTVKMLSYDLSRPTQMKNVYVSSADKHLGLTSDNITWMYP